MPRIPPLFENNNFITDCKEKATKFNDYFAKQCTPFLTDSVLPPQVYHTNTKFSYFNISNDDVKDILKTLKLNKATGPDEISVSMIQLCADPLCDPLRMIFQNMIDTRVFRTSGRKQMSYLCIKKRTNKLCLTTHQYFFCRYLPKSLRGLSSKTCTTI